MKKLFLIAVALLVVLTAAWNVFIYYDNNFPFGRMWETPGVRPYETKPLTMEAEVVPFDGGEAIYRAIPGKDLESPLRETGPALDNKRIDALVAFMKTLTDRRYEHRLD